jgi:DNA-binding response OmpR family regulator
MVQAKILIVEDEILIAKVLARRLEKLGYAVVSMVDRGTEAISASQTHAPDLILMDIVIKGPQSGLDVGEFIQKQFGIPVIYATACSDPETLRRVDEAGEHRLISKPFNIREVKVAIERVLDQKSLASMYPPSSSPSAGSSDLRPPQKRQGGLPRHSESAIIVDFA